MTEWLIGCAFGLAVFASWRASSVRSELEAHARLLNELRYENLAMEKLIDVCGEELFGGSGKFDKHQAYIDEIIKETKALRAKEGVE